MEHTFKSMVEECKNDVIKFECLLLNMCLLFSV